MVAKSNESDQEIGTPPYIFKWLDDKFQFTLDAAASNTNHLCPAYFTKDRSALEHAWVDEDGIPHTVFLNPPYGRGIQDQFFEAAHRNWKQHGATVVLLVPVATDTRRWHTYVKDAAEVWLLKGKVKFIDSQTGKPMPQAHPDPTAFVIFDHSWGFGRQHTTWKFVEIVKGATP